ncbi:hypothetical protein REPUB_Repub03eG0189100 [Reevesia pubescens]
MENHSRSSCQHQPSSLAEVSTNLIRWASGLRQWDKHILGQVEQRKKQKQIQLQTVLMNTGSDDQGVTVGRCKKELTSLMNDEEIRWSSKALWFREGDRNTKYFHGVASRRRRNNRISQIVDDNHKV